MESDKELSDVVQLLKSEGIFDQFRKDCVAAIDDNPDFILLKQRVEAYVARFLEGQTWSTTKSNAELQQELRATLTASSLLRGIGPLVGTVLFAQSEQMKPSIRRIVDDYLTSKTSPAAPSEQSQANADNNNLPNLGKPAVQEQKDPKLSKSSSVTSASESGASPLTSNAEIPQKNDETVASPRITASSVSGQAVESNRNTRLPSQEKKCSEATFTEAAVQAADKKAECTKERDIKVPQTPGPSTSTAKAELSKDNEKGQLQPPMLTNKPAPKTDPLRANEKEVLQVSAPASVKVNLAHAAVPSHNGEGTATVVCSTGDSSNRSSLTHGGGAHSDVPTAVPDRTKTTVAKEEHKDDHRNSGTPSVETLAKPAVATALDTSGKQSNVIADIPEESTHTPPPEQANVCDVPRAVPSSEPGEVPDLDCDNSKVLDHVFELKMDAQMSALMANTGKNSYSDDSLSVSSVHTSDLSSFDDEISLSSSDKSDTDNISTVAFASDHVEVPTDKQSASDQALSTDIAMDDIKTVPNPAPVRTQRRRRSAPQESAEPLQRTRPQRKLKPMKRYSPSENMFSSAKTEINPKQEQQEATAARKMRHSSEKSAPPAKRRRRTVDDAPKQPDPAPAVCARRTRRQSSMDKPTLDPAPLRVSTRRSSARLASNDK